MSLLGILVLAFALDTGSLEQARDRQDRATLSRMAQELSAAAQKNSGDAGAHYRAALAGAYLAEVAIEQKDKAESRSAAEAAIREAQRAVELKPAVAEYHRVLGMLCGQAIPGANLLVAMKWGKCAQESINKAIELDPKSALAYVGRGVGNFYLPGAFGGGAEVAIKDFEKAIQLDSRLAESYVWLGIALRKANRNAEARKALERAIQLNPRRVWAKEQLSKTPAS
ncbi:MAG: tetratricopeptide repeat protein [Acidobacteria bacterium]|nr:tetratricopeptide repeat protein [Acidobacteriota bacterium]